MRTIDDFRRHLQETFDTIEGWCRYGTPDFYTGLEAAELAEEAQRLACRFGCDVEMIPARTPQEALRLVGMLLDWTRRPFVLPEMLTQDDLIRYLRLDVDDRDPVERVRNLMRYQGLPVIRRGRLLLFRKTAVDNWLDVPARGKYARRRLGRGASANLNRKETA